jgi:putative ABC transport system ATP-binding protein
MSVVKAEHLIKNYRSGSDEVQAIKSADFVIEPRAFVSFVGPSGSGKTTLLNLIGCLDRPTSGTLEVMQTDISTLDRRAAARFRGEHIGFIFQDYCSGKCV